MSTIVEHAQRSKHEAHKQHRKSRRSNSPRHQKFSLKELITGNNRSLEAMQNELDDYRCIYQHEVKSLTDELVSFREQCQNEIVNQAQTVEKKSQNARKEVDCNNNNTKVNRNDVREQNRLAEKEAELLKRTQDLLNREDELIEREDELTSRQEGLASYKQEIDSLEEYLDRRMTAIKRREEEIIELDQDIKQLSSDLKSDKEKLLKDSGLDEEKSKKGIAQLNWDFVRKSMIDKHSALEKTYKKTVQEMNAKEQVVEELKSKVDELSELIEQKDTKIIELEARLSLTVTNDLRQSNITRTRSLTSPPTNHNASNGNSRRTASLRRHYSDSATKYTDNDLNSSTTCAVM